MSIIFALLSVSFTLLTPVLIGMGVDLVIGAGNVDFKGLLKILFYLLASACLASVFQWMMSVSTNKLTYNTSRDMRKLAFERLVKMPLGFVDNHQHGDIISRITADIEQVADGLLQGFTQLFSGIVTILGTLAFMFFINPYITLVVIILTPLSFFISTRIAKMSYDMFSKQFQVQGELTSYINEMVGNQRVIKAFRYEDKAQATFEEINSRLYGYGVKAQFYSSLTNPSTRFVNGLVYAAVGIAGAILAVSGLLTVGQITSFLNYANQYTKPFNEISGVITQLQSAIAGAERIFYLIDGKTESDDTEKLEISDCKGYVSFENVDFSYNKKKTLIRNFNLKVSPGMRVAIVGPTGSGKTTLINLLMRFYDTDKGTIWVDETDIKNIKRNSLRRLYGMVLQETWLFEGTIKENIAYGKKDASMDDIIKAAKAAYAHNFIVKLPNGYDTMIVGSGDNLSQGQRQLLCIARAMLMSPPMLILDEATSSIDTLTEIRIQEAFQKLMQGKTSFIVAHRLSTIRNSDIILVMKDGQIAEQGNHQQLMANRGFYFQLNDVT
ncbi:MAG: ABC transporter ATP-binding protein [Eubacteriales bacterium]|nr:ABC transporter ATP-binding protein [Eubacteriales bacterium]